MTTLVDTLSNCLTDQKHGLVNFNAFAKHICNTSSGVLRLLQKGNLNDIKTNLVNLQGGEEERVIRKEGATYYVDPRLAVAFAKLQRPELQEPVTRWETVYGRGDVPQELAANAPALFQHLTSVFSRNHFRCTFQDGKWYFCLNDVVQAATVDVVHVSRTLAQVFQFDPNLRDLCKKTFQFSG